MRFRPGRGILVICRQGLGDAVQTLPLVQSVCRYAQGRCPVRVLFHSRPSFELFRQEGLDFIPYFVVPDYDGRAGLLRLCWDLRRTSDLIISPPETSASKTALLRAALGARSLAGEADPPLSRLFSFSVPLDWNQSFLDAQQDLAAQIGLPVPLPLPAITVTPAESSWARSLLRDHGVRDSPILGIQASSAIPDKQWPAENFGLLVRRLRETFPHLSVLSFGLAEEKPHADRARAASGLSESPRLNETPGARETPGIWIEGAGQWSIRQTLAALSQCDLFVSGDTGLMHMAAAVSTKTLSIFGPTSPARRAPFHQGGLAVAPETPCHPCFRRKWSGCTCIQTIQVERVRSLAEHALAQSASRPSSSQSSPQNAKGLPLAH